jgi:hypothetical protein
MCCSQWSAVKENPASTKSSGSTCPKKDLGTIRGLIDSLPSFERNGQFVSMVLERLEKWLNGVSLNTRVADARPGKLER